MVSNAKTVTTNGAAWAIRTARKGQYSIAGSLALVEWLESLEQESGMQMPFDAERVAHDYHEFASPLEAAKHFGFDAADGECTDAHAMEWLTEQTTVIEFSNGVVVSRF